MNILLIPPDVAVCPMCWSPLKWDLDGEQRELICTGHPARPCATTENLEKWRATIRRCTTYASHISLAWLRHDSDVEVVAKKRGFCAVGFAE
jgi:hypothetical protein